MSSLNLKNITEDLLDTFLKAGRRAKEISKEGIKVEIKADKSPVTNGDIEVNEILTSKIKKLTPNIAIISEETFDTNYADQHRDFWLIDPIDGTKDYIKNKDEYTLNAALISDLKPKIGIIYAPAKNRLFFSYGQNCAFEIRDEKKQILDCKKVHTKEIIGLENSGNTSEEILEIYKKNKVTKTIKMSSSLKFCILAAGEADIYAAKARAFEWDIAAGHAILEHAGGSVVDHNFKNFLYGKPGFKNLAIIAKRSEDLKK